MGQVLSLQQAADTGNLFGLPPLSVAHREFSDAGALTQAEYELHRAENAGGDVELALWARRWGQGLIDTAREVEGLREEAEKPLETGDLKEELGAAEKAADGLVTMLKVAAHHLNLADVMEAATDCLAHLQAAQQERENL